MNVVDVVCVTKGASTSLVASSASALGVLKQKPTDDTVEVTMVFLLEHFLSLKHDEFK